MRLKNAFEALFRFCYILAYLTYFVKYIPVLFSRGRLGVKKDLKIAYFKGIWGILRRNGCI